MLSFTRNIDIKHSTYIFAPTITLIETLTKRETMTDKRELSQDYPDLVFKADSIKKYLYSKALGTFTLSIDGEDATHHFTPPDPDSFKLWLQAHNIENISAN